MKPITLKTNMHVILQDELNMELPSCKFVFGAITLLILQVFSKKLSPQEWLVLLLAVNW